MFEKLKKKMFDKKVKKIIEDSGIVISEKEADKVRERNKTIQESYSEIDRFEDKVRHVFREFTTEQNNEFLVNLFQCVYNEIKVLKMRIKE